MSAASIENIGRMLADRNIARMRAGAAPIESRIITITLNPAVDRVMRVERFRVGQHCAAKRTGHYPAGKGVNVSRVLAVLGVRSVATGFVGQRELGMFEEYLEQIGKGRITTQLLVVRGRTRDNITIVDPIDDTETHLRDEGFSVTRDDVVRVSSKVGMLARADSILCFSGSLPPGVCVGDFRSMLHRCDDAGARAVVDTNRKVLRDPKRTVLDAQGERRGTRHDDGHAYRDGRRGPKRRPVHYARARRRRGMGHRHAR
ncbi:MAG: 1-phosphofructokinase family hexose kinase [Phycisphaerales bacterium]